MPGIVESMGFLDRWRKPKKKPISKAAMDTIISDLQAKEEARKASRPEVTLSGGEKLYFEKGGGDGGSWSSDKPVFSDAEGRQWSLMIDVDREGDHPSADQHARLSEVRDHLTELLAQFAKRLPEECLEFDPETTDPPATFEELSGWTLWLEAPSTHEDYEWQIMCEMEKPDGSSGYAGRFVGRELVGISPTY